MILDKILKKDLEKELGYNLNEVLLSSEVEDAFQELLGIIFELKEENKRIIKDRNENYKQIPYSEQVGISDKDFI